MDELTEFRMAYLRAIATAWTNPAFEKELIEGDAVGLLKRTFGYDWPWEEALDLKIIRSGNFAWTGDDWSWPEKQKDKLTLHLPLEAREIAREHYAIALSDYYSTRPSPFGKGASPFTISQFNKIFSQVKVSAPNIFIKELFSDTPPPIEAFKFPGHGHPSGGFVPSRDSFLNLGVALLSLMAKSWVNAAFRKLVDDNTESTMGTIRGYKPPWQLTIDIEDDREARWSAGHEQQEDGVATWIPGSWSNLKQNVLTLHLPKAPEAGRDQVIALAAYNTTGAEYPFTCCP